MKRFKPIKLTNLAAYTQRGYNTVGACFGVEKITVMKLLKSESCPLDLLGNKFVDVKYNQLSWSFMVKCLWQSNSDSITATRLVACRAR